MKVYTLKLGEVVWDDRTERWGKIVKFQGGGDTLRVYNDTADLIVTLNDDVDMDGDSYSEWETDAESCYQIAEGLKFQGQIVCHEHYHCGYPYYCPTEEMNLFCIELDNHGKEGR